MRGKGIVGRSPGVNNFIQDAPAISQSGSLFSTRTVPARRSSWPVTISLRPPPSLSHGVGPFSTPTPRALLRRRRRPLRRLHTHTQPRWCSVVRAPSDGEGVLASVETASLAHSAPPLLQRCIAPATRTYVTERSRVNEEATLHRPRT